ncbi:hypothetical protein I7I53_07503 [Histoplasma capsulatum var. duboisii H88]|uniref:Uncharacterized protein n=1 Tax=Ajellomyces capsulatus (strain H88) TaxID=544711 RepID=A0A8A1LEN1_AJEC8|nr:hypothetical protein I7I53_07503 [Histoplasma capsulatum var. duboisii H88]
MPRHSRNGASLAASQLATCQVSTMTRVHGLESLSGRILTFTIRPGHARSGTHQGTCPHYKSRPRTEDVICRTISKAMEISVIHNVLHAWLT